MGETLPAEVIIPAFLRKAVASSLEDVIRFEIIVCLADLSVGERVAILLLLSLFFPIITSLSIFLFITKVIILPILSSTKTQVVI